MSFVLDTSPLLVYVVGAFDKHNLTKISYQSRSFDISDFEYLSQFLRGNKVYVTPQILAELSNVIENSLGPELHQNCMHATALLIRDGLLELYVPKNDLLLVECTAKFGFADASLFCSTDLVDATIITGDFPFYGFCCAHQKRAQFLDAIVSGKWFVGS